MIDALRDYLTQQLGTDTEKLDEVLACFKPLSARRNELLLQQGTVCRHVYFVAEGCLQVYSSQADGNETTRDLITEANWCSELISFGTQQPANENIRAVEPTLLCALERKDFQRLTETVPAFDRMYKAILEASYANSVYRLNTFVALPALERVRWLMAYRPGLMARLPSKLIASYLGISQETLSRLKGQL